MEPSSYCPGNFNRNGGNEKKGALSMRGTWMGRILLVMILGGLLLSTSACSEQREKIADLFRWGQREVKHEVKKVDAKAAEDLDMSKMTVESLKEQGIKMSEIAADAVFVSPERQQISGIRFGQVRIQSMEKVVQTVGKVEFDEKKIAAVSPKIGGWVEDLYVDYTGKIVRKGQP